ncbi:hypothetical protein RU98_GL000393 [Enterococcus caccae]|nr:hypothetical protein RU98_GL000393 [Enterococcus caccae]
MYTFFANVFVITVTILRDRRQRGGISLYHRYLKGSSWDEI